jgi:hypothetical protein
MENEIIDLIKEVFEKYKINIPVDYGDIYLPAEMPEHIRWKPKNENEINDPTLNNKIRIYFESNIKLRNYDFSRLFHYLKYEYAIKILENNKIQLSSLSYLWKNDPLEYSEFFRRIGMDNISGIEKIKDNIFVFCLSDNIRNEEAWKLYGNNESGIAIGFKFKWFSNKEEHEILYLLKDVYYYRNCDFDFYIELQNKLFKKFKRKFLLEGLSTFSKFYKREKYSWEREIRLCFDYDLNEFMCNNASKKGIVWPNECNLKNYFNKEFDIESNRHFISVPLKNDLFELEINEIICGKKVSDEQMTHLKTLANNSSINIWRRI